MMRKDPPLRWVPVVSDHTGSHPVERQVDDVKQYSGTEEQRRKKVNQTGPDQVYDKKSDQLP